MLNNLGKCGTGYLIGISMLFLFFQNTLAQESTRTIGPEDVLTIIIYVGGVEENTYDVSVSDAGIINAPLIGSFSVAGMTPIQLEEKIGKILARDYFVDPIVYIRIKEFHTNSYFISGAVNRPGFHQMAPPTSLLELIAEAGWISVGAGNEAYVMKTGGDQTKGEQVFEATDAASRALKIDLSKLLETGDQAQNPTLSPGDVVYIPPKAELSLSVSNIYIHGGINTPGIYRYEPGLTALKVCLMAGGFSEWAALKRAKIYRKTGDKVEVIKINLDKIMEAEIPDVELKPEDRLYIPD